MKYQILFAVLFLQFTTVAQEKLKGTWALRYIGSAENVRFDINDPSIVIKKPGETSMNVKFATTNDSLNKEMSATSHDIYKNCPLKIINNKKFILTTLTIVNGVFKTEDFSGNYFINSEKKEIQFDAISQSTKKILFSLKYFYEIKNDELILTNIEYPEMKTIYKRN